MSTTANRIRTEAPSGCCSEAGEDRRSTEWVQWLTLALDGITAGDYLSWVTDAEPSALGRDLRCVTACAEPLGERIEIELIWDREPPAPRSAVLAAGFPLFPEVVELVTGHPTTGSNGGRGRISGSASRNPIRSHHPASAGRR